MKINHIIWDNVKVTFVKSKKVLEFTDCVFLVQYGILTIREDSYASLRRTILYGGLRLHI